MSTKEEFCYIHAPQAAVAIIRVLSPEPQILLIERTHHPLDPWSGHLAFPGGKRDSEDFSLLDTAMRETKEEIGVDLKKQHWSGVGEHAVAGHYAGRKIGVATFYFDLDDMPHMILDRKEVAQVHVLRESEFLDCSRHTEAAFHPVLKNQVFPYISVQHLKCWGFTYERLLKKYHMH